MAIIEHSNFYGPLDPDQLRSMEQHLGSELPNEYRQFLLEHNGGVLDPNCFVVPGDEEYNGEPAERVFDCFFAVHDQPWNDSTLEGARGFPLQEAWRDFASEVPDSITVPIGKDVNGSYLCLGYTGEDRGRIFFYDHEYEVLRPLAESFGAFLGLVRPCEEN